MSSVARPEAREETACNLCGARNDVVVGTRDRDGHPLRTVLCRTCGLVWTNPRPTIAEMNAYYGTTYRADYKGQRTPPLRKIVRGFIGAADRRTMLRPLLTPRKGAPSDRVPPRMLDVGCGAGELVYLMRHDGVDASGLDPGIEFAEFARAVLEVPIQTAAVDAAVVPPASQDLVTMFHALEHVPDPRGVLSTVLGWLTPGGHLLVEVPNISARVQAPSHQYHYAHLHHFTGATLGAMGEAAGLRLVSTAYTGDRGNVICVFERTDDGQRPPAGLEAEAARTLAELRSHTALRHYTSPVPFTRALGRLRRRLSENRLLLRLKSVDDVLRWADSLAEANPERRA
ncbi:MAG TPA: class I SAM-dependent methyltransferase [Vicinamibacterales bacterium]|nr:class I SAM-dependent methyltransferase [Vicinamibacterales bacterium]